MKKHFKRMVSALSLVVIILTAVLINWAFPLAKETDNENLKTIGVEAVDPKAKLEIKTGTFQFFTGDGLANTEMMRITNDGKVGIGTTSPASTFDVNGIITATSGNSTNWNTAYGWGNHSTAGYITPSSTDILTNKSGNISMWTNNLGYLTSETDPQVGTLTSGKWCTSDGFYVNCTSDAPSGGGDYLPLSGGTITGNVYMDDASGDSPAIYFEDGSTTNNSYIQYFSGTSTLRVDSDINLDLYADQNIKINSYNGTLDLDADGAVNIDSDYNDVTIDADDDVELFSNDDIYIESGDMIYMEGGSGNCIVQDGNITCTGNKNAKVFIDELNETFYLSATEAATVDFYERGVSRLNDGKISVTLSEDFQHVISQDKNLMVFVTPLGPCSLYVSDTNWNSFKVEKFNGDKSCEFNWIAYAYRKGYENVGIRDMGINNIK